MHLQMTSRVSASPDVMARAIGDETVLLHLSHGSYFGLDAVGTRIWQLIGTPVTLAELRDALTSEFDVSAQQMEADLLELMGELQQRQLIVLADEP